MNGVLVVAELEGERVRARTLELIAAARTLSTAGAGPVSVLVVASEPELYAQDVELEGVAEVLLARSPLPYFEAHVSQAAVDAAVQQREPAVVLAAHAVESFGFAPALAAAAGLGLATDVTDLQWTPRGARVHRGAYAERLVCELELPPGRGAVILLRTGAVAPASRAGAGSARRTPLQVDLSDSARSERIELREPPPAEIDITTAPFLLAAGRGIDSEERLGQLEELAELMGATVCVSRPLVDAGWASRARQVGQSGRTVAPRVYLAMGVSGAAQHVAGIAGAKTVIAVNSDPHAPIFRVARYRAVADLAEVAQAMRARFGHRGDGLR